MKKESWFALGLLFVSTWVYPSTRIQVEGHGATVDQARQNGFRQAIEQVVGQVIISDQEVSGDQLTKDFIGGYSAGYVDDYEVLETKQDGREVSIKMNVAVASSKIAQRMMSSGNKNLIVEGQQLQAQIDTQLDQRGRGDAIIAEVLSSYPYNAFVVNSGQTDIAIGARRQVYIDIPYDIHWSKFWLEGVNEALGLIAVDSKSCNSFWDRQDQRIRVNASSRVKDTPCGQEADLRMNYKVAGDWMAQTHSYYFYDKVTLEVINNQLQTPQGQQHIGLIVELKDAGGQMVGSRCARIDTSTMVGYTEPQFEVVHWNDRARNLRPVIYGQASVYGILRVHLRPNENISDIARARLTVDKTCV